MLSNIVTLWSTNTGPKQAVDGPLPVIALVFIGVGVFLFVASLSYVIISKVEKEKERKQLLKEIEEEQKKK